ncbi:hypothetical protein [Paenibacillus silvae]|uniref:Uncharacterized protein n=1 Tax=Paenibacillus silvae TaxID=1325358 RepID=A0A2W6NBA2_9BACL|nr:hypothetical protein [Paenibacillus silvae]PZT53277.1 hypothetical protein DN757_23475 [Paenibacillus silvae]
MDIKNQNGDFLGKIQMQSLESDHVVDQIIRTLRPGDGKAIYIADAEANQFTQQTNYAAVEWQYSLNELKESMTGWQPKFPSHAEADHIQVYYGFDNLTTDEIEAMAEESRRTGQKVVVRDLKPNNTLVGVRLTYKGEGTCTLHIFGTTKSRIQLSEHELSQVKNLLVRGAEAFYFSNHRADRLIWIEAGSSGKALQYELIGEQMSEAALIQIAETMKEKQDLTDHKMKKTAVVSLYFLSEAEGGQRAVVKEDFSAPVVFDVDQDLQFGLWSAVVKLHRQPDENRKVRADLHYLFHNSAEVPTHLLTPGNTFSLRTNKVIARGEIESIKDE